MTKEGWVEVLRSRKRQKGVGGSTPPLPTIVNLFNQTFIANLQTVCLWSRKCFVSITKNFLFGRFEIYGRSKIHKVAFKNGLMKRTVQNWYSTKFLHTRLLLLFTVFVCRFVSNIISLWFTRWIFTFSFSLICCCWQKQRKWTSLKSWSRYVEFCRTRRHHA